jgi:hypothetical protein
MSYSDNILVLFKDNILKAKKDTAPWSTDHTIQFALPVINEQLKSYKVFLQVGFYTRRDWLKATIIDHFVKLGYGIYKGQKKMSVLGRKEYLIHSIDETDQFLSYSYSSKSIDEKIHDIHQQIESLVYDKYFGNFVNMTDDLTAAEHKIQQTLLETAKEKGCVPRCCVCYDPTKLTTPKCKHSLCLECYQQLPLSKKCPMCRMRLFRMVKI